MWISRSLPSTSYPMRGQAQDSRRKDLCFYIFSSKTGFSILHVFTFLKPCDHLIQWSFFLQRVHGKSVMGRNSTTKEIIDLLKITFAFNQQITCFLKGGKQGITLKKQVVILIPHPTPTHWVPSLFSAFSSQLGIDQVSLSNPDLEINKVHLVDFQKYEL